MADIDERPLYQLTAAEFVSRVKLGGISEEMIERYSSSFGIDGHAARYGFVRYRHLAPYFGRTAKAIGHAVSEGRQRTDSVLTMMNTLQTAGFDLAAAKQGNLVDLCEELFATDS